MVKWATDALDGVRREAWNNARKQARSEPKRPRGRPLADAPERPGSERAKALKGARYALWKNPEDLTDKQQVKLAWVATTDPRLYRGYLLKEGLRVVFQLPYDDAVEALNRCSASAVTNQPSQAGNDPQVRQERRFFEIVVVDRSRTHGGFVEMAWRFHAGRSCPVSAEGRGALLVRAGQTRPHSLESWTHHG